MQTTYVFLFCLAIYTICSCSKSYDGLEQTDLLEITAVDTLNDLTFRAAPAINSITGPTYLPYVQNGKWQGNVPACGQGSYFGYYVINTHDNNAADNYWYINGSNFGSSAGSVTSSSSGVTLQVLTWSNTQIKVRPKATYLLDYKNNLTVKVITNSNGNVSKIINVLGMIKQGRGFGQCTWVGSPGTELEFAL